MIKEQRQERAKASLIRTLAFVLMFLILAGSVSGIGALLFKTSPLDETGRGDADVEVSALGDSPQAGTAANPWKISTKADLVAFAGNTKYWAANTYTEMTADIDWGGSAAGNWTPIGNATTQYQGNFDGKQHAIKNLYLVTSGPVGIFGFVAGTLTIKNLGNVNGYFSTSNTNNVAGGIVGGTIGAVTLSIVDCFNTGTVLGSTTSTNTEIGVGGILGDLADNANTKCYFLRCFNTGKISSGEHVGGILGENNSAAVIRFDECFNAGTVGKGSWSGGILGHAGNVANSTFLENCYNVGSLETGTWGGVVGHIVNAQVNKCYNTGTGANYGIYGDKGTYSGTTANCYNNQDKISVASGGTNRTTAQMYNDNTLTTTTANGGMSELGSAFYKRVNGSTTDIKLQYYPELASMANHSWKVFRDYSKASVTVSGYVDPGYNNNVAVTYDDPGTLNIGYFGESDYVINNATINAKDINNPVRGFVWQNASIVSGGTYFEIANNASDMETNSRIVLRAKYAAADQTE